VEPGRTAVSIARHSFIRAGRPRTNGCAAPPKLARFFQAVGEGHIEGLIGLLDADVVAYAEGGVKAQTFTRPVYGRERIARLLPGFETWLRLLRAEEMEKLRHVDPRARRPGPLAR
jgi:hypothetical protein